ncbi:heparinase II/III-family protein [Candidatus Neomarinimicrobiota bacterium]
MIGYVVGNRDWVDMALWGTKKDSTGGFLKQVELLFSPDGYYMEGPYYVRYAMRPLFKFAEAIERNQPELDIYNFQDGILKKAVYSAANTAFPNGAFAPINDASQTMNIRAIGVLLGTNSVIYRDGPDENLLALCDVQGRVFLNGAGLATAKAYAALDTPPKIKWSSIEYTDGAEGNEGGLGILRSGEGADQSVALMKYGVHGLGHGHFDKLQIIFYDQGKEIVNDYGFSRWINMEPKFGGRYLPENNTYAKQTIAHNTVVIDGKTQNDSDRDAAELVHGERHFFNADDPGVQVMSAQANDHYDGVKMQRTVFMLNGKGTDYPALVDIYRVKSSAQHRYDYPIHYTGQFTNSNVEFAVNTKNQVPLGSEYGYQHIWNTAEATIDSSLQFSWVDEHRYYTVTTADMAGGKVILGRIGANDPNYNLRSEPMVIARITGDEYVFVSVIEPHGYFDEATESSRKAFGDVQTVDLLGRSDDGTVVEVTGKNGLHWTIAINNGVASATDRHSVDIGGSSYEWLGNFSVEF